MAKQKGIIKLKGTLNGLCYYKLNGEDIVRKAVGPSKERINNDPAFIQVKGNNQEFAAAVYLTKSISIGLGSVAKAFKDSYMHSRLTGVCRKIIQKGEGTKGQREANLFNDPESLIGFQLHKEKSFNQIRALILDVTTNAERNMVTITIQRHAHDKLKKYTKSDRQVVYTAVVGLVAPQNWNKTLETYEPMCAEQNGLGFTIESKVESLNDQSQSIQLQVKTNMNIDSKVALTVWLGMSLVETTQNKQEAVQSHYGMQCIAVL
ncbi:hypothetical protein [Yeosuana marina]|uniref:hypothetical protein n=1 Tax=Yeosuana marina TaxID=1565536 RepID=UPI00141E7FB1|nr:hypothetical protein [Yeosuana marina]